MKLDKNNILIIYDWLCILCDTTKCMMTIDKQKSSIESIIKLHKVNINDANYLCEICMIQCYEMMKDISSMYL